MGVSPPVVAVLALAVTLVCLSPARAADCRDTNCLFEVRDECQTSERVACNLQHGPNGPSKQVRLTRTSFPRHVRRITLSHTDTMTVEEGAIAKLNSLEDIELTNIGTLTVEAGAIAELNSLEDIKLTDIGTLTVEAGAIAELNSLEHIELTNIDTLSLLPGSLQCGNHTGRMTVIIRRVKSLHLHPETFSGCDISFFNIADVAECQIDSFVLTSARIGSMDLRRIHSLTIKGSAIGANTDIGKLSMKQIGSLSLAEGALANDTTVREVTLDSVTHMVFSAGAIQANVSSLTVTNVNMSTCEEHAFGTAIQSLSLNYTHINLTRKGCISSPGQAEKLTVSNSTFNLIEAEAIRGNIKQVRFMRSKFGRFAHRALSLTVTAFSIENSKVDDITGEALEVLAKQSILFRKCQINHLRAHGLQLLHAEADAIRIEEVHISHPEKNSLQFHSHSTRIIPWELDLGVPCTCDALNDLNIHALTCKKQEFREDRGHWLTQTRCQANGDWPLLGQFIRESCPDSGVTTPAVSSEQPGLQLTTSYFEVTTPAVNDDQPIVTGLVPDVQQPDDRHAHDAEHQQTSHTGGVDTAIPEILAIVIIKLLAIACVMLLLVIAFLLEPGDPCYRITRPIICKCTASSVQEPTEMPVSEPWPVQEPTETPVSEPVYEMVRIN